MTNTNQIHTSGENPSDDAAWAREARQQFSLPDYDATL